LNSANQYSGRFDKVAVIGAGAWGTALAQVAAVSGRSVRLWGRNRDAAAEIARSRENRSYLPGVRLDERVQLASDLQALAGCDLCLLVTPAQTLRAVAAEMAARIPAPVPVVVCAKGIERDTGMFVTAVVQEKLPDNPVAILSGPSFASDVVRGLPTAVTVAASDEPLAQDIAGALAGQNFRIYHSGDVRGVEIGGAAKNVLAIACGIVEGRNLGASAKAALIARGFAELRRFGAAFGARDETLMGLSGLGDLVLTCGSAQSRNFAFGVTLAEQSGAGVTFGAASGKLAEGAFTAQALARMAREAGVDMPIVFAVEAILNGAIDVDTATAGLMARPQKGE